LLFWAAIGKTLRESIFSQKKVEKPVNVSTQEGMKELVEDFFGKNFRDITSRRTIEWGELAKAVSCSDATHGPKRSERGMTMPSVLYVADRGTQSFQVASERGGGADDRPGGLPGAERGAVVGGLG